VLLYQEVVCIEMRILFLAKRQYMGRDLLDDRYGRFREIPLELARLQHEVLGICFSYRRREEGEFTDSDQNRPGEVTWQSINLGRTVLPGIVRYWQKSARIAAEFKPDVVIAGSDAFHVIRGERLARSIGAKSVSDLYDNFEAYAGAALPGLLPAFRAALRRTDLVLAISAPLARKVREHYGRRDATEILENGIRQDLFYPRDRRAARVLLGLPVNALLIGTAGALSASRDIGTLLHAADLLAARDPRFHLVVAGHRDPKLPWPKIAPVHDLGVLDHAMVPDLFSALDVMVTTNQHSTFGDYCHPQKLCEAIACGVPVVTAATGWMSELFAGDPRSLYRVGDAEDLANAIADRVADGALSTVKVEGWDGIALRLSAWL
jgi:teichuronic acid biosynthesis glycosyltransferase TuaC